MDNSYVHYGCGLSAPKEWLNFDSSPTLRLQKTPLFGNLLKNQLNVTFPSNVKYGDITKGLPIANGNCKGVYCSHVLEHLSLSDFRVALKNTYDILKVGGIFRCILPDLEYYIKQYIKSVDNGKSDASIDFMKESLLGIETRPKSLKEFIKGAFGNSHHLWMWDYHSLSQELGKAGFKDIRRCSYNDSEDEMFKHVEEQGRFVNAVGLECKK